MLIHIGCTIKPVDNWQTILPTPKAPSNYKDPKKIDAYIQEKLNDLLSGKAAEHPLVGAIDTAVIMRHAGEMTKQTGGVELIEKLAELYTSDDFVCGYKIYRNLRFAMIEYNLTRGILPDSLAWLYDSRSYGAPSTGARYFDPVSILFGTSDEDRIDPDGVVRRLGLVDVNLGTPEGLLAFSQAVASRFIHGE